MHKEQFIVGLRRRYLGRRRQKGAESPRSSVEVVQARFVAANPANWAKLGDGSTGRRSHSRVSDDCFCSIR